MPITKLLNGFRRFHDAYFEPRRSMFEDLVLHGQHPQVCVVACADSRVSPAIVLNCEPGQIFEIRNVANIVPACSDDAAAHSTAAALEYAVIVLQVEHILVLGHAKCGGIRALVEGGPEGDRLRSDALPHVNTWIKLMEPARARTEARLGGCDLDQRVRACEQEGIRVSLENLRSFAFIRDALDRGTLALHGWYLDIAEGRLFGLNAETGDFDLFPEDFQPHVSESLGVGGTTSDR